MNKPNAEQLAFLDSLIHIIDTRCHDGFNGHMIECRLGFDEVTGRTICVHKTGWFAVQEEMSFDTAAHNATHSKFYRNFECNRYFVPHFGGETF